MDLEYVPTHLEEWISSEYKKRNILCPEDLTIPNLSKRFDFLVRTHPRDSASGEWAGIYLIHLDNRIDPLKQKENFYHELCHVLRHVYTQDKMPQMFFELQEYEARNFVKYAAIPYHMLMYLKRDEHSLKHASELFGVPVEVCEARLNAIKARQAYKRSQLFRSLLPAMSKC
ncbi:ImmA/IrrE family metallo-endopeptidase [Priestia aryabhattai]|uniref:ImmA/IrrE family metallo-endopeptidase n=1 Tax=Priestia aryabhattai TaxID=412384 RepID=UPI001C8D5CFB|nr:ImmA/IrrE family metallo-endopeptidase [Priestia aryabhattai]MBX9988658.1 ImmA/IrrE family metallo-endopeptidase [Priestia aryabhattai]